MLFLETLRLKSLNLLMALCTPLMFRQENESAMNFLSKNGYSSRWTAWCKSRSRTLALCIILGFGSFILKSIPKHHKFSLGEKIDKFFVEIIDAIVTANFLSQKEKLPFVRFAIRRLDVLKVFLMMLWETKSLDNKKYIALYPIKILKRRIYILNG